jgi:protein ImuA
MAGEPQTTREIVRSLQEKIRGWERDHRAAAEIVSSGCPAFDRLLADGGFCRGTLVEWLAAGAGSGAATLALAIAARASRESGALVVVDRPPKSFGRMFYPPATAGFGIDWKWFVVVRPRNDRDEAWALDQVLRSPGVGSVLAWPRKLTERRFRQLQLAAETGGTLGLLVRPEQARDEPSWAEVRLLVQGHGSEIGGRKSEVGSSVGFSPRGSAMSEIGDRRSEVRTIIRPPTSDLRLPTSVSASRRRLKVEVIRSRSGSEGGKIEVELDEETGALYEPSAVDLAPRLAAPAADGRATRA